MKATIVPSLCHGQVTIPSSKSMAHRAIICASLAQGKSVIQNIDYSVDIQTTIDAMIQLGASITCLENSVVVEGIKDFNHILSTTINCNESGSSLRFLIPLFSLTQQKITFTGKNRLLKRPQHIYQTIFKEKLLYFNQNEEQLEIQGALPAGTYTIQGNVSSQFISGLCFALPLLHGDSTIQILPPFESKSYLDLTIQMLQEFGITIQFINETTLFIPGNQKYLAHNTTVEGDYSQFAFFAVLAAINHDLDILGVRHDSKQGDRQIIQILKDFNVAVETIENGYRIKKSDCLASTIDLSNCPDLGPICCTLAMFSKGTTHLIHANRLRLKESDRIEAMESECSKLGCEVFSTPDSMTLKPQDYISCHSLKGWKDHRIVMALAIACTLIGGTIDEAEAISKSYPSFFDDLRSVGIEVFENVEG